MVLAGEAVVTAAGVDIPARVGDIVVVDAETPHKFRNSGSDRLQIRCIPASPRFVQEWLPEPAVIGRRAEEA